MRREGSEVGSQPSTPKRAKDKEESSMALVPEMTPKTTLTEKISMEMRQLTERYLYILHNRPKEFVFLPVAGWPQWPQFGAEQHGDGPGANEELKEFAQSAPQRHQNCKRQTNGKPQHGMTAVTCGPPGRPPRRQRRQRRRHRQGKKTQRSCRHTPAPRGLTTSRQSSGRVKRRDCR